jgi:predicted ribosome quality control (RQC) complex YloA/Tae2 family protein
MRKITKYIDAIKGNIEFRVGQNAQENFDLIDDSNPDDLWFHISQESSCHVVAKMPTPLNGGVSYDKKTVKKIAVQGAVVCKQCSRYKSEKDVSVNYTLIKHLEKGSRIGSVLVDNYKTLVV